MSYPVWDQIDAYKLLQKHLEAYLKSVFPEQKNEIEVQVRSNLRKQQYLPPSTSVAAAAAAVVFVFADLARH